MTFLCRASNESKLVYNNHRKKEARTVKTIQTTPFTTTLQVDSQKQSGELRWLETVSTTFQDLELDGSLYPFYIG